MAKNRKPMINLALELGIILDGDAVEALVDLYQEPDAMLGAGDMARAGAALGLVADALTKAAKDLAALQSLREEGEVFFTHKEPSTQTRVNTKYLREKFPAVNYPEMWQETPVAGSVSIDLPFNTK